MRSKRAVIVIAATLLSASLFPSTTHAATWQDQMLISLNSIRAEKGLQPVKICKTLTISAQKYSRTMAQQNFFAHEGKDGSTPGERMQSAGYDWENSTSGSMVAENIAAGQQSVSEVMKGWKKSTSHYKNMTESRFIHVGFGMSENKKSKFKKYWVQNFGYGAAC